MSYLLHDYIKHYLFYRSVTFLVFGEFQYFYVTALSFIHQTNIKTVISKYAAFPNCTSSKTCNTHNTHTPVWVGLVDNSIRLIAFRYWLIDWIYLTIITTNSTSKVFLSIVCIFLVTYLYTAKALPSRERKNTLGQLQTMLLLPPLHNQCRYS